MPSPLAEFVFQAEVFHWRGPAPFFFAAIPEPQAAQIHALARRVTYGWGMIPVQATLGVTTFTTSLFPKDGRYLLPIKVAVRRREDVTAGDAVAVRLQILQPD